MDSRIHYIISQCAQRMYLLKLLRHQGMSGEQLSVVTYCIIVSRILYALPAWGGFLSAELTNKINALFRRLKRFGYMTCNITVSDLIDTSGCDRFRKLCSSEHSLHHLLPTNRKYSNFEIVVITMNSRSIVLTCIKSLLLFNHCICTFDFFKHLTVVF